VPRITRASKVTSHQPIQDGRRPAGGWSEEDHRQRENAEGEGERGDRGECDDKGSKCERERRATRAVTPGAASDTYSHPFGGSPMHQLSNWIGLDFQVSNLFVFRFPRMFPGS